MPGMQPAKPCAASKIAALNSVSAAPSLSSFALVPLSRPRLIRGDGELAYLLRALRNTLVSQRRTQGRRPVTAPLAEELGTGSRPQDDPAAAAEAREVHDAIRELPEEFRDALVAVDVAGLSYAEAARALGVPQGTVTSRLFRARDRLATRLDGAEA